MLTVKKTIRLSAIIRKLNLPFSDFAKVDFQNAEELESFGFSLIETLINKLPEVEKELYDFLSVYEEISKEEAENMTIPSIIRIFQEIIKSVGGNFKDFLASPSSTSGTIEPLPVTITEQTT